MKLKTNHLISQLKFFAVPLFGIALFLNSAARGEDLSQVSTSALLNELNRRFLNQPQITEVNFGCVGGNLQVQIISSISPETKVSIGPIPNSLCEPQAKLLQESLSQLQKYTKVVVCRENGEKGFLLQTVVLVPSPPQAVIAQGPEQNYPNSDACLSGMEEWMKKRNAAEGSRK